MKKGLFILMAMLLCVLMACQKKDDQLIVETFDVKKTYQIDQSESQENVSIDDKSDVSLFMSAVLEKIENDHVLDYMINEYDYPINKAEIDTIGSNVTNRDFHIDYLMHEVYNIVENTLSSINQIDAFQEGVYMVENTHDEHHNVIKDKIYKTYINDQYLYIERYSHDLYMTCDILKITFENDQLSYEWYSADYSEVTYTWEHVKHTSFIEGEAINYISISFEDEAVKTYTVLKYNMVQQDYIYISNEINVATNSSHDQYIEYEDLDRQILYSISFKNNEAAYIKYSQYDALGQYVYWISQGEHIKFEYNLMMMDGWDQIDIVDEIPQLFYQNQMLTLPENVSLKMRSYDRICLIGETIEGHEKEIVDLLSSHLVSPISYDEFSVKNEQIIHDGKAMLDEQVQIYDSEITSTYTMYLVVFDFDAFYALVADWDHE